MTDHPTPTPAPQPPQAAPRRRGFLFIAMIAIVAALTGAIATTAISQGFGPGYGRGFGPGFGPGHWRQGGMMGLDLSQIEDRADRGVRHFAVEIDATPEQQEKLRAIVKAAVKDLVPMRDKLQGVRQRAQSLLTQQGIDRAAAEAFRAEQVALVDAASKRLTQALADAADVLTPEQRQKLQNHLDGRRGFGPPWHRG